MEHVSGVSPSWATVLPRFMNQMDSMRVDDLYPYEYKYQAQKPHAGNKPGKIVILGLDALSFQLAVALGKSRLCSELILFGEPVPTARKNAQYVQQLCLLSGSVVQVTGGFDPALIRQAGFILRPVQASMPRVDFSSLSDNTEDDATGSTRPRLVIYGDSDVLKAEVPVLSHVFSQFVVVGLPGSGQEEIVNRVQEYLEAVLCERPFTGTTL